jgi:hypothetical protein
LSGSCLSEAFGLAEVRGSKLVLEVGAGLEMVMVLEFHKVVKLFCFLGLAEVEVEIRSWVVQDLFRRQ